MKNSKLSFSLASFVFFIVMLLSVNASSQSKNFVGKWVITPSAPSNVISHLTISEKGNGFEISRTKEPGDKWSALFDKKSLRVVAIIDGKMIYFTCDSKTGLLNLFDNETDAKICELKKE